MSSDENAGQREATPEVQAGSKPDDQQALWNGRSGSAWVDNQALLDRMFVRFEEMLAEVVAASPGTAVLDVGCGTGATTLAAARRAGGSERCVGVDVSAPMIELARARAEREQVAASFVVADAQTHAFEAESFDTFLSRFGVMFFADPVAAFTNLRRAGRDGAAMHFIAWRSAEENPFMTTAERAVAPLLELPPRKVGGPGQFGFADAGRVREILAASGWAEAELLPIEVECALPASELERYFTRLGPLGTALQSVDAATGARVIEAARAAFEPFVHGDEARYTAACWMIRARCRGGVG